MQYTENYQFRKPVIGIDVADVKDINFNSDRADTLIHNTQISLAPAYDLNETYDKGDVVMYETLMYKCKADNTTGAWDASKWERTTAGEEGAGGGGGSSVVPNPQGSPTDTLETIEIDGTVYDIAGSGGGSEGSAFITETNLWKNTSGAGVGTYTLSESINDFDFIAVRYGLWGDYTGGTPLCDYRVIPVKDLQEMHSDGKYVVFTGYEARVVYCDFDDTTMNVTMINAGQLILQVDGINLGSGVGKNAEVIPVTAGDGTANRTFTFDKTPKFIKVYWEDATFDGGWTLDAEIAWGQPYVNYKAHSRAVSITGLTGGLASIVYGADGKSFTITGGNAFGAWNTSNGSGFMFIDYGGRGGESKDISDMTWTQLASTTSTSTAVAIPSGTKKLVLTAQLGGIVTKVAEESMANIQKLLDVSLETTWNMGGEYADTAGNHTTVAMSVSNGQVVAKSGYSTVTAKVYALS